MAKTVSKRTGNRRLLKLAAMLQADAKNKQGAKFDIGVVARPSRQCNPGFVVGKPVELDCGTTCCAMGLAAISGKFKKAGLSYKILDDGSTNNLYPKWNGREIEYDTAAMKLFNIERSEAQYLFAPHMYPVNKKTGAVGEREVIKRIKRIVAGKTVPRL